MDNGFLQQVARSIIATIDWKQLSRTTLVLPSHRAGLVLKEELLRLQQEQHAQAIWAPIVQTLTQLQDALSPLYAEDELFTVVRLFKLYKGSMPLDMFYPWGRQIIADFTNIDASMPASEVPNFFENTIAAHELEQWKLDPETEERLRSLMAKDEWSKKDAESVRAHYETLWHQLYELYTGLKAEMTAEQKGYPGLRQRAVIEHWNDEEIQSKIAGRTYIFVGFNYLLPVERELMTLLRDANQAMFYWDYVPNFQTNEKAFAFTRQNAEILGNTEYRIQSTDRISPLTANPSPLTVIECSSREAQAQYVHRWLQTNYTAKGQKVGIVICDETMLEPVIYTLPAVTLPGQTEPEPINITKGFPLRNTDIYARTLAWLNDKARGKAEDLVSPDLIGEMLDEVLNRQDENLSPLTPNPLTPNPLSWQELLILESEYQVRKIANQMRLIITNGLGSVPFTLKLLRLLMRRTMENVTMPFHGEPVTDIQVMGVLETRLLDFDKLLILNVEEGVIPQRQNDISFIPFYLRKVYHMQTPDEKATIYAYNFFRLLSRAGQATVLYATAETAEGGKGMSRFLMQILYSPEFTVTKSTLQEQSVIPEAPDLNIQAKDIRSALTHLSPSALNTYITCPRSFYLQYIEKIQAPEEEEVLFEANTLGSFVHHAMEYIYTHYLHCDNTQPVRVLPDEIEAIRTDESKIQAALDAAYARMNEESPNPSPLTPNRYVPAEHNTENVVIKGYINNILERDREDAKIGLQIYLLEQPRYFSVPVEGVGEIRVGGKIDRLDIFGAEGNQKLRIIDYKSGSYNDTTHAKKMTSSWEELMESEDKGYVRQTMLYSHAVMAEDQTGLPIEPNLYFCRRKLTDIVTTIDIDNETVHDYRSVQQAFFQALQNKIKQLLTTTEFPKCEPDHCPSFCPFFRLCGRKPKDF